MSLLQPQASLALETRQRNAIANNMDRSAATHGEQMQIEALKRRYPRCTHRNVGPSNIYNCHGLTFASRRTRIYDPNEIKKILVEDEYLEVTFANAIAGDIVVYFSGGDPEHSGIIVERDGFLVKILSKWGSGHEVIHPIGECPYDGSSVKFFRIVK